MRQLVGSCLLGFSLHIVEVMKEVKIWCGVNGIIAGVQKMERGKESMA